MTDLLDRIAEELNDVETRVLVEFRKIQNTPNDTGLGKLQPEFREEIHTIVNELKIALERSGSADQLRLTTEQHENLRTRIYVINQILDRQIPIAAFQQATDQLHGKPRPVKPAQNADTTESNRKKPEIVITSAESKSILETIRGLFRRDGRDVASGQLRNVETEAPAPKEIYQDTGVYAASQELAMLALVVTNVPPPQKADSRKAIRGKASFEARDITLTPAPMKPRNAKPEIAQTPEEIRRKLEARRHLPANKGKAVFGARDVSNSKEASLAEKVVKQKQGLTAIKPQPGKGKATFVARDVQSIATDTIKLKEKLADLQADMSKSETSKNDKESK